VNAFESYFGQIITLLKSSKVIGDVAWRSADRLAA